MPLIREVSTQPAQPEAGDCTQRCTSSQRPERRPGRHFPRGPQVASHARTNDMPSESCRGPRSGVPLRPHPSPFYLLLPSLTGSLADEQRGPLDRLLAREKIARGGRDGRPGPHLTPCAAAGARCSRKPACGGFDSTIYAIPTPRR